MLNILKFLNRRFLFLLLNTLRIGQDRGADIIQVITFNDFTEGTQIEPTIQDQYQLLEVVQDFTGINKGVADLQTIKLFYDKYDSPGNTTDVQIAFNFLRIGDFTEANSILSDL